MMMLSVCRAAVQLRKFALGLAMFVLVAGAGIDAAAQATFDLNPTNDAYVQDGSEATVNFGSATALDVKDSGGTGLNRKTFLRFNVSAIPANATSVTLKLYGSGPSVPVLVYAVSDDSWTEGAITWNTMPAIGSSVATSTVGTATQYWTWDLTSFITGQVKANQTLVSMALASTTVESNVAVFNSKEATSNLPELEYVVPQPGAPTVVSVTPVTDSPADGQTELQVSWNAGLPTGTSYSVFRGTTQGGEVAITSCVISGTTCTDSGLTPGTYYYYEVKAVSAGGTSSASNELHGVTNTKMLPGVAILVDPLYYVSGTTCSPGTPTNLSLNTPVMNAVCDLQNDLYNLYGMNSTVYSSESSIPNAATSTIIVITATAGQLPAGYIDSSLTQTESHELRLLKGVPTPTAPQRMVLQGADMRGTLYAIYEFSDSILGVPPLYRWTGWTPPSTKLTSISIPANYSASFATPVVKYRVAFLNDGDLIGPWMNTTANFDAFFETLLRLKYNVFDVDTISDVPSNPSSGPTTSTGLKNALACKARGLIVGFTHYAPFGADFSDWDNFWNWTYTTGGDQPGHAAPTIQDENSLETFWKHYINLAVAQGLETIQTIAFRGKNDEPWWELMTADDPAVLHPTWSQTQIDQSRATTIQNELGYQITLFHTVTGQTNPLMRVILYDELQQYLTESGVTFNPPSSTTNPNLIWNFANTQRDHVPGADIQAFSSTKYPSSYSTQMVGYYENIEYRDTGSHMTSNEGPYKMEDNLSYVSSKPATGKYVLSSLNMGNFREFTMEIAAGANMYWNGLGTGPNQYSTANFLPKFAGRYFVQGPTTGAEGTDPCAGAGTLCSDIANVYTSYYNDQWQQKPNDFPATMHNEYIFQDLRYYKAAHVMIFDMLAYCYMVQSNCNNVAGEEPNSGFLGNNPFLDNPPLYPDDHYVYEIVDDPGDDQIDTLVNHTSTAATNFSSTLSSCNTEMGLLAAPAQVFFEDSLCSHVEAMYYLNQYVKDLGLAARHVDDTDHSTTYNELSLAITNFNSFQAAYGKRSTAAPFANWYILTPPATLDFNVTQMNTDLVAAQKDY